jgi:hypothetical protein
VLTGREKPGLSIRRLRRLTQILRIRRFLKIRLEKPQKLTGPRKDYLSTDEKGFTQIIEKLRTSEFFNPCLIPSDLWMKFLFCFEML